MARKFRSREALDWANEARRVLKWSTVSMASLYTYLKLSALPYASVLSNIDPGQTLKVLMIFYAFCWFWGLSHDIGIQGDIYASGKKMQLLDYLLIFSIPVVGAAMLWFVESNSTFQVLLGIFFALNVFMWRYLLRLIKPIIQLSKEEYSRDGDFIALEQVKNFEMYIFGRWQIYRFAAMAAVLAVMIDVSLNDVHRILISDVIGRKITNIPVGLIYAFLPVFLFAVFFAVEELWILDKAIQAQPNARAAGRVRRYICSQLKVTALQWPVRPSNVPRLGRVSGRGAFRAGRRRRCGPRRGRRRSG